MAKQEMMNSIIEFALKHGFADTLVSRKDMRILETITNHNLDVCKDHMRSGNKLAAIKSYREIMFRKFGSLPSLQDAKNEVEALEL